MPDDSPVEELLQTLLDSGGTPEEVCRTCPELLPQVRAAWQRLRAVEAEVSALFPEPTSLNGSAPRALPAADLPRIPGYEVQQILGRGGMGVVYKAWHQRLNRAVALKMLLAGAYARPEELQRFLREAEAVAGLNHANIVQVHDVGGLEGRPYFTMELVEGGSLAQKVAGTPQPARQAAALVATVAEAIQVAHQSGIIHRDLTPSNILLTADGTPKITDFGLARRLEGGGLTLSGVIMGTPSYMAPEQARGQKEGLGPASDTYALGAILYELLTGRPPFRSETAAATLHQVLSEDPIPPSRLVPRLPRDLETICLKCLQKEPQRRYASAAALASDLRRFLRGEPIAARPLGPLSRLVRWVRRRPTAAALSGVLLAAVLLALALVGVWLWLSGQRTATVRAAAEDLREVTRLQHKGDLVGARVTLERAKGRLGAGGPAELQQRLERAGNDLELVARLDAIRLDRAIVVAGVFNRTRSNRDYEREFRAAGLGTVHDAPGVVAARVAGSPVRRALVAALDDWAVCTADARRRAWLLEVARTADPDPWRDQVRDPQAWEDRARLYKLAETAAVAEQSLQLLVALGERLQARSGDADAVHFLRRVQQAHPTDFYANFMLANALAWTNRNEDAVGYYRAALAVRPDAAVAWYNFGDALRLLGRLDEAIAALEQCVRLGPRHGWAHAALGSALRAKSRTDDAIDHLQAALWLGRDRAFNHTELARALQDKRRWEEAIAHYRTAVKLAPNQSGTHFDLGMALKGPGRQEEAIAELRKSVSLNPNWSTGRANLGRMLLDRSRLDEAASELRQAVTLAPGDQSAQAMLRTTLIRQGRLDEARAAWQKALAAGPPEHDAWFGYAELCLFLGHEDEYRRHRRALLVRFGGSTDPLVAERTGRACLLLPGAKDELEDAAALVNRTADAGRAGSEWARPYFLFAQGLAEYRRGRLDDAIALMNGGAANVMGPCPRLVTALALHRKGQQDQALQTLTAAILSCDWSAAKADSHDPWIAHILRREAEALILPNLPAFLEEKYQPQGNDERLALLGVCQFKDLRTAQARLYVAAFAADPKLAEDLRPGHRCRAARAAAVAGCGGGADGARLSEAERARWRQQARAWLLADLAAWAKTLDRPAPERSQVRTTLEHWLADSDLAGLREPKALDRLPDPEAQECRALWDDVQALLRRI